MLIDANLLLYAVNTAAPQHDVAAGWLVEQLNGERRVGLPWESLVAFTRVITNPRAVEHPLSAEAAWEFVEDWLAVPTAWIPMPTERHHEVLGGLIRRHRLAGRLILDGHLTALAIEHGLEVASADSDFARFPEIRWVNPLR